MYIFPLYVLYGSSRSSYMSLVNIIIMHISFWLDASISLYFLNFIVNIFAVVCCVTVSFMKEIKTQEKTWNAKFRGKEV